MGFTVRQIESLRASGKRYEVVEPGGSGLCVRVHPNGRKLFRWRYQFRLKRSKITLGEFGYISLAEARERIADYRKMLRQGIDPVEALAKAEQKTDHGTTLDDLFTAWRNDPARAEKQSLAADVARYERAIKPVLGDRRARDIKRADIKDLFSRKSRTAPVEANRIRALISTLYNYAIKEEFDEVEANPAAFIDKNRELPRDHVLHVAEVRTFWHRIVEVDDDHHLAASSHMLGLIGRLELVTWQRTGNCRLMHRSELDREAKVWTIPGRRMKNGKPHRVPLTELALDVIDDAFGRARHDELAFPNPLTGRAFGDKALARKVARNHATWMVDDETAVRKFTPHDLRRSATTLTEGVSRADKKLVLGHYPNDITDVYDLYAYDAEKRSVLEVWERRLRDILANKEPIL